MLNKIPRGSSYFPLQLFYRTFVSLFKRVDAFSNKEIQNFENKFAQYIGTKHAIAVSSGKLALYLSLKILELKPKDEIIVTAFTVPEVIEIIRSFGVIIKFIDISASSCNIDHSLIEKYITDKTKVIVMIHMFGQPVNVDEIFKIAKKHNLYIIEDCAQSIGAEYKGEKIGNFGDISYFSFGILKDINTLGGGMIITENEEIVSKIREEITEYREQKKSKLFKELIKVVCIKIFTNPIIFNFFSYYLIRVINRFSSRFLYELFKSRKLVPLKDLKVKYHPIQAKLGLEQLKTLNRRINMRIENANFLTQKLKSYKLKNLELLKVNTKLKNTFYRYPVKCKKRDLVIKHMLKRGIDITPSYALSFHSKQRENQNAKVLAETNLLLPVDYTLTKCQVYYIAKSLKESLSC